MSATKADGRLSALTPGMRLTLGGALLYLVCMFLPWFSASFTGTVPALGRRISSTGSGDGWDVGGPAVFAFMVILLAATVVAVAASSPQARLPVPAGTAVLGLGALATLLVVLKIIVGEDTPDVPAGLGIGFDVSRSYGIFLALAAAAAVAAGGHLMSRER
jgi:hypothetical protein